jgi:hypothetical protein
MEDVQRNVDIVNQGLSQIIENHRLLTLLIEYSKLFRGSVWCQLMLQHETADFGRCNEFV